MNNQFFTPSVVRTFPLADLLDLQPGTHIIVLDQNNIILGIGGFVRYSILNFEPGTRYTEDGYEILSIDSIVLDTGEFPFPVDGEAYFAPLGWRP